ncbi:MAG: single-stranded-DNA-specific exonuclease RecJ [Eubacterium sp.]|nr:single-stranded-DNA-specific exonuclease RecJ [Eubacterium sp.]
MQKWVVSAKKADFNAIALKYRIDPVTARIMRNRDIQTPEEIEEYLYAGKEQMHSPVLMKDMEKAVSVLLKKIKERKKIRIIGDYDIDGICASYILLKGLSEAGAEVSVEIPDRIADGYGINETLVEEAYANQTDTIVTCDNGIAAFEAMERAKDYRMTVIVTDHHEVPYETDETGKKNYRIVPADAVVNPKQEDCPYPYKNLCGAAVAYKLIQALFMKLGKRQEEYEKFLQFAGIATVGDVMVLTGENRIFVKEGLRRLNQTENTGLRALVLQKNLRFGEIKAYHIGFVLGPCLNASGRLDTAKRALQLLLEENPVRAAELASELDSLNESRKELTAAGTEQAVEMVEQTDIGKDKVLVIYLPACHESIAGIIAGRIRERYHKPVFVLTKGEDGVKGSGRSIKSYSMYEEMCRVKDLFTKFGGHPMAAGLSMPEENVPVFRQKINELSALQPEDFIEKILIDVPMPFSYLTKERIRELEILEPFGNGNEKPVFAQKNARILSLRIIGKRQNGLKMQLKTEESGLVEALYFGNIPQFAAYVDEKYQKGCFEALKCGKAENITLSFTYYPQLNTFQGMESIQVSVSNYI